MRKNTIEEFMAALYDGVLAWEKAGKVLVAMLKHNPDVKRKIVELHPEVSMSVLAKLEAVGRGVVKPELLLSDNAPYKLARKLPVSEQQSLLESGRVPLFVVGDAGADVINADFKNLSPRQARQVFADDHIRDGAEQRLWLESTSRPSKKSWAIEDGMVVFRRGARLTVQQLSGLVQELATRASSAAA